jgi:hypothetical protein
MVVLKKTHSQMGTQPNPGPYPKKSGVSTFLSYNLIPPLLKKYFPSLKKIIEAPIVIKQEFKFENLTASDFLVGISLNEEDIRISFDPLQNCVIVECSNLNLHTFFGFLLENWLFNTNGTMEVRGKIKKISIKARLTTRVSGQGKWSGLIPSVEILKTDLEILAEDMQINIGESWLEIFEP